MSPRRRLYSLGGDEKEEIPGAALAAAVASSYLQGSAWPSLVTLRESGAARQRKVSER